MAGAVSRFEWLMPFMAFDGLTLFCPKCKKNSGTIHCAATNYKLLIVHYQFFTTFLFITKSAVLTLTVYVPFDRLPKFKMVSYLFCGASAFSTETNLPSTS